jgi:hypothetical protein
MNEPLELMVWIGLPLGAALISIGHAWRRWLQRDRSTPEKWREKALLLGLLAASLSTLAYCLWLTYHAAAGDVPLVWRMKHVSGEFGTSLFLLALLAAVVGKGAYREALGIAGIVGIFLWMEVGVL